MTATSPNLAFEHARPLARLLALRGLEPSRRALAERMPEPVTPDRVAALLGSYGMKARAVKVTSSDLRFLSLPTIVFEKSGSMSLLVTRRGRSAVLDDGGSGVHVSIDELERRSAGIALEIASHRASGTLLRDAAAVIEAESRGFVFLFLASIVLQAFAFLTPLVTRAAIDTALPDGAWQLLGVLALAEVAIAAHRAWTGWLRASAIRYLHIVLVRTARSTTFARLLRAPFGELQKANVGVHLQALASVESLVALGTHVLLAPFVDALLSCSYLVVLFFVAPKLAATACVAAAVLAFATAIAGRSYAHNKDAELSAAAKESQLLFELVAGIETTKALGAERVRTAKWLRALVDERICTYRSARQTMWLGLLMEVALQCVLVTHMVWGVTSTISGVITIGTFIASYQLCQGFLESALHVNNVALQLWDIRSHWRRIGARGASGKELAASAARSNGGADIVLDDVWFRYGPDQPWILRGYSLRLENGEHRTLDGPSGTGKTTILRLIAGLYEPERGHVSVGGLDPSRARGALAYMPQETYLFEGSLLSNLELLSGGASLEEIARAARVTGLQDLIDRLPMGFETLLAAGGSALSGGQRQLVVLTACVASKRTVVLLDESFSHLDTIAQRRLDTETLFPGRTVVCVRHERGNKPSPGRGTGVMAAVDANAPHR